MVISATVLSLTILAASFTACKKAASSEANKMELDQNSTEASYGDTDNFQMNMMAETSSYEPKESKAFSASKKSAATGASSAIPQDRKLIRTGSITFEVDSLAAARDAAEKWVSQYSGYVSDSSEDGRTLFITAQIPSVHFDEAMSSSSQVGTIKSKEVNSTDVSDEYYDLDSRLGTKRILLERLDSYLKKAKDVKDLIDIEEKINDVTSDIESMQGQLNRLSKQIDYSTITLTANLPVNQTEQGYVFPDAKSKFREFWGNILSFFCNFLFILLYIIIYGIPIVLLLFFLYWLCFGKIGLLRKLFAKVRFSSAPKISKTERRPIRTNRQQQ